MRPARLESTPRENLLRSIRMGRPLRPSSRAHATGEYIQYMIVYVLKSQTPWWGIHFAQKTDHISEQMQKCICPKTPGTRYRVIRGLECLSMCSICLEISKEVFILIQFISHHHLGCLKRNQIYTQSNL